jgi:hypothetical protein
MRLKFRCTVDNILIIAPTLCDVVPQRTHKSSGARGLNTEQKLSFEVHKDPRQNLKNKKNAARYIATEFCYKLFPKPFIRVDIFDLHTPTERIIVRSLE